MENNEQKYYWHRLFIIIYLLISIILLGVCLYFKELIFYNKAFNSIADLIRRYPWTIIWCCFGFAFVTYLLGKDGCDKKFKDDWLRYIVFYPSFVFIIIPFLIIHLFHQIFLFNNYSYYFMSALTGFCISFCIDLFSPYNLYKWLKNKIKPEKT